MDLYFQRRNQVVQQERPIAGSALESQIFPNFPFQALSDRELLAELPNGLPFQQYRITPGPNPYILEIEEYIVTPGSRYTQLLEYRVLPPLWNNPEMALQALFQRIRENTDVQWARGVRIRVVREVRETLVTNRGRTRVFHPQQLLTLQAYINFRDTVLFMFSSNDEINFEELRVYLDIDQGIRGGASEPIEEPPYLKDRRGITLIPRKYPNLCGWMALACYAAMVDERYMTHHHALTRLQQLTRQPNVWVNLAKHLREKYGFENEPQFKHPECTEKFLRDYPNHRVVIVEGKNYEKNFDRPVILHEMKGSSFVNIQRYEYDTHIQEGGLTTCYLWMDRFHSLIQSGESHFHFLHHPDMFFKRNQNSQNRRFCHVCFKNYGTRRGEFQTHECQIPVCEICQFSASVDHLNAHKKGTVVACRKCEMVCYNETCRAIHEYRCTLVYDEINRMFCKNCRQPMPPGQEHSCYLCINESQDIHKDWNDETIAENLKKFYVFDFESEFIQGQTVERKVNGEWTDRDIDVHRVNYVVVQRCSTNEVWEFDTLDAFIEWMRDHPEPGIMLAHNMKGYDGRLIFNHLLLQGTPPTKCMWVGNKIMAMKVFKWNIRDTLTHLAFALEQLPKVFGLDETLFKKGYFPYKFNLPQNRQYIGPMPAIEYFEPDMMHPEKRRNFIDWYNEESRRVGNQYNFWQELREYCLSDVRILCKAVEVYMSEGLRTNKLNPLYKYTIAAYAQQVYMTYHMPEKMLAHLSQKEEEFARRALHGGRTDVRTMFKSWTKDEVAQGYYGCYQDVQSLYPTVQFYKPMPVGRPIIKKFNDALQPTLEMVKTWFGFVECDLSVTRELFHPVIVNKDINGKLMADLRDKKRIVLTTPELLTALDNGYELTKVYEAHLYRRSDDLFKSYIQCFLQLKIESGGMPSHIHTDEDWQVFQQYHERQLGIHLTKEKMVKNAGRKQLAKLMLNSLWGKFAERTHNTVYKVLSEPDELLALELQWDHGDIDIVYRHIYRNGKMVVVYKDLKDFTFRDDDNIQQTNVSLAAFVTAWGALILWQELHKLGDRVLYHDTDSIIYARDPQGYNIPLGHYLGEWEDETGGDPIVGFVSTGPKSYAYKVQEPAHEASDETLEKYRKKGLEYELQANGSVIVTKHVCKAKGFTLNAHNAAMINFKSMHDLLLGNSKELTAQSLKFVYRRGESMHTEREIKIMSYCYDKGYVDNQFKVWPWGYDRFRTWSGPRRGWVLDVA